MDIGPADRGGGRVVASHRIAASAFRTAGLFGVVAILWALWVALRGGSWWGPVHSFLAGSVLLAISGATQLFTITWSAAPAPRAPTSTIQRWALAGGVALVLIGMTIGGTWAVGIGVVVVVTGLVILAGALISAIRRSLLRRFDLSSRFYLLAISCGVVGVTLGGLLGVGALTEMTGRLRLVHYHLNLVGLVGLTIIGTLPTILPTFSHHRVVSGREAILGWWVASVAAVALVSGLVFGEVAVGVGTILGGVALLLVLGGVVGRLGRRGLKGGMPYLQVTTGCAWLAAWAMVDGASVVLGSPSTPFASWTGAAVVAGVGQVLLGSLAYLVPVLAGRPPRLGRNLQRTHARPWIPLTLANLAGIGLVLGWGVPAAVAFGLWVVDFGRRLASLEWRDAVTGESEGAG